MHMKAVKIFKTKQQKTPQKPPKKTTTKTKRTKTSKKQNKTKKKNNRLSSSGFGFIPDDSYYDDVDGYDGKQGKVSNNIGTGHFCQDLSESPRLCLWKFN